MTRNGKPGDRSGRPVKRNARQSGLPPVAWLVGLLLVAVGLFLVRGSLASANGGTASTPIQAIGKPKLTVDRDTIDLGRQQLDKIVKATFKLTDTGDKPLTVNGAPTVQAVKGC